MDTQLRVVYTMMESIYVCKWEEKQLQVAEGNCVYVDVVKVHEGPKIMREIVRERIERIMICG